MLFGIIGNKGAGKTLLGTTLSIVSDCDVITNLSSLKLFNNHKTIVFNKETLFEPAFYTNKVMFIDEYYLEADKRNFMSRNNKMWSYFAQMSRKYPIRDIFFLAQRLNLFDSRVTEMFDFLIMCRNNRKSKKFEYLIIRTDDMRSSKFIIKYEKAEEIFQYFDTYEIPIADKIEELNFFNMSLQHRIDYAKEIAEEIVSFDEFDDIRSLSDIEGYCIKFNYQYDSETLKLIRLELKTMKGGEKNGKKRTSKRKQE